LQDQFNVELDHLARSAAYIIAHDFIDNAVGGGGNQN
jgi:hypothetical protein